MNSFGRIKKGEYFDSVTLMKVSKELSENPDIEEAVIVMGTNENKNILKSAGFMLDDFKESSDTDLLMAVRVKPDKNHEEAFKLIEEFLENARKKHGKTSEYTPQSLEEAIKALDGANFALISVAGKYASFEAQKALENGLNVMLFSDNISIEDEIKLKNMAHEKGLLVMGPDCGTAIINGVPLAFANVVNRGDIGIVAASGTGLQELTSIISNAGGGISQAIGTGGRDVKKDVGGITFIDSIKLLNEDPETKVILLAGKPPHQEVLDKIKQEVKGIKKPVISVFLGSEKTGIGKEAKTFEEAALKALAKSHGNDFDDVKEELLEREAAEKVIAGKLAKKVVADQKYIRGLFSGGTFCTEAQVILKDSDLEMYSNAPIKEASKLKDSFKSKKHTFVDMGEDEFTAGKPHPMIDYSLRNKRIIEEANDKETALIMVDIVLGYGSNMTPLEDLKEVISEAAKKVRVICSITGTNKDPQDREKIAHVLGDCGAIIFYSNAAASNFAKYFIAAVRG